MTVKEFREWSNFMVSSTRNWKSDPIWEAKGEWMFFIGGESGRYLHIDRTGKLEGGEYEGAVPHLGEALFRRTFTRQFESKDAALKRVIEVSGRKFLLDFIGSNV